MAIIYQIYPLSFLDTNNDGIGDINGITKKISYLKELGVEYLWITPIFLSPMEDNGYDVSDYYKINPIFGTIDDLVKLIKVAASFDIKIMLDLVLNHTSTEHYWFKEAIKSVNNKYHDYYIWSSNKTNINSFFGGSAWEYIKSVDKYYLHLFSKGQADLNWKNKKLREELYEMINYYIDLGIKGFRLDVLDLISKNLDQNKLICRKLLNKYLVELYEKCFKDKDIFTVGEMGLEIEESQSLSASGILSSVFQFNLNTLDEIPGKGKWELRPLRLIDLKQECNKIQQAYKDGGMPALFWSSHDQPRAVGRYCNLEYRYYAQTMLFMLLYLQKGHIFIYQGEEFGMSGFGKVDITYYQDVEAINYYHKAIKEKPVDEVLTSLSIKARDHARTPMQWNSTKYAGFSKVTPWFQVNQNYKEVNFNKDYNSNQSIYKFLKDLLSYKSSSKTLQKGSFILKDLGEHIFSYERVLDKRYLVVCNFGDQKEPIGTINGEIVLNNYQDFNGVLNPYQAVLFKIE